MSYLKRVYLTLLFSLILCNDSAGAQEAPGKQAPGKQTADKEVAGKGLDDYVARAMKEWDVPGLALAIVKDDKVVLSKGYGVRKLGQPEHVDAHTVFAIASNTKSFTAAALAMLVDEGRLRWDDPVVKHLPKFEMHDPYVTRELTLRDLLCNRCGLQGHDLLWMAYPLASRDDLLRRVRYLPPYSSFRSKYCYQNMMFLVAGQLIPATTGKSWDAFIKDRIFTPLGMKSSSTSVKALAKASNVATPHEKIDGKPVPVPWRNIDNMAASGGINSSAADMTPWLRLWLNQGVMDKKRLLSVATVLEMQSPQMVEPRDGVIAALLPDTHFLAYGLGWRMLDYRGRKVVLHGGNLDGMVSQVLLVPEEKLGIVVLTNCRYNAVATALPLRIVDAYVGGPARDYSVLALKEWHAQEAKKSGHEAAKSKAHGPATKPSLALASYAGTFHDDLYGDVRIVHEKSKLVLRLGTALQADLDHWHTDLFRATWKDPVLPKATVAFRTYQGKVADMRLTMYMGEVSARKK